MATHPTSEWIRDITLSDRARVIVAILQRFGAHNRPTLIHKTEPFSRPWFSDNNELTGAAWRELCDRGAIQSTRAGDEHLSVRLIDPEHAVAVEPDLPQQAPSKRPRQRKRRADKVVH